MEREACYGPILAAVDEHSLGKSLKVLVPGAGLGRLVFELSRRGHEAQGNEISYHQLLTAGFMLNHTSKPEEWAIHPWALSFVNIHSRDEQLTKYMVPDVHPGSVASPSSMSMVTGSFSEVYVQKEFEDHFDVVATVFFIDTAPNLISYIETVRQCLKEDGLWINLGPLLWHGAQGTMGRKPQSGIDTPDDPQRHWPDTYQGGSFELSNEEVMQLVQQMGFTITTIQDTIETGYAQNPASMLHSVYKPSFWIAKKLKAQ